VNILKICDKLISAVLIELAVVGDNVTVIVGVTDTDSAVLVNTDVVVAISDIKAFDTPVGFDRPAKSSVLFPGGNDP
jgi:hypothetical protein